MTTLPHLSVWRPRVRADCARVPRPCPHVGCRYSLALEVERRGGSTLPRVREPHAPLEAWQLPPGESCALDLADAGPVEQLTVARLLAVVPERVRQIERAAQRKLAALAEVGELADLSLDDDEPDTFVDALERAALGGAENVEPEPPRDDLASWLTEVCALVRKGVRLRVAWAIANRDQACGDNEEGETMAKKKPAAVPQGVERSREDIELPVPIDAPTRLRYCEELAVNIGIQETRRREWAEQSSLFRSQMRELRKREAYLAGCVRDIAEPRLVAVVTRLVGDEIIVSREDTAEELTRRRATAAEKQEVLAFHVAPVAFPR